MVKFSENLGNFFNSAGLPGIRNKRDVAKHLRKVPASAFYIHPGHILVFSYKGVSVVALVVSTRRGNGIFTSTQNNPLVSAFKLDTSSEVIIRAILEHLYRNPRLAKYGAVTKSLNAILGKHRFRTYNLRKMVNIHQVEVSKEDIRSAT